MNEEDIEVCDVCGEQHVIDQLVELEDGYICEICDTENDWRDIPVKIQSIHNDLIKCLTIAWDRSKSDNEFRQEVRLMAMDHGYCLKCGVIHEDGFCDED